MMETLPGAGCELLVEVVVEKDLLLLQLDRLLRDVFGTDVGLSDGPAVEVHRPPPCRVDSGHSAPPWGPFSCMT